MLQSIHTQYPSCSSTVHFGQLHAPPSGRGKCQRIEEILRGESHSLWRWSSPPLSWPGRGLPSSSFAFPPTDHTEDTEITKDGGDSDRYLGSLIGTGHIYWIPLLLVCQRGLKNVHLAWKCRRTMRTTKFSTTYPLSPLVHRLPVP